MPSQLNRRRAPVDVEQDDGDYYDDPPWQEDEQPNNRRRDRRDDDSRSRRRDRDDRDDRRRDRRDDDSRSRRRDRDDRDDRRRDPRSSRDVDSGRSRSRERDARPAVRERDAGAASRGSGWDAYKDQRSKKAGPANRLQVKDEAVVHFLEPEPFAIYEQHWIGQRSYTCPDERDCPMCDEGLPSRTIAMFNVTDMETAENMYIEAGPRLAGRIRAAAEKNSTTPIDREDLYFAINRTKQSNGFFDYELDAIKERDLYDDYKYDPLTDSELDEALTKLFDKSVIPYTDKQTLRAAAEGEDDD